MARRKKRSTTTQAKPGATNIVIRNENDDIARRSGGGTRRGGTKRRGGGGGRGSNGVNLVEDGLAGAAFGLLERVSVSQGLPEIPILGRKGTVTLLAYLFRKQHPLIAKTAKAGVMITSYQLIAEGRISGEDEGVNGAV